MESGFFDLQVNGSVGVDFNADTLTAEGLHHACESFANDGVGGILATIITERVEIMAHRLRRLAQLREADPLAQSVIAGVHIEGPFLNPTPGFRGAHPEDAIIPADVSTMELLLDAAQGLTRLVTLAPEADQEQRVIQFLANQGIAVAAGHCDPSLENLDAAIDAGLTLFTHLGNGCPMTLHRHDNVIQRALSRSDRLWICFIADGAHIPFFALRNYLRVTGLERGIIVTDAIAAAGLGPGLYTLGRWNVLVGEDRVARAPDGSHLIGAAITMPETATNLKTCLQLTESEIRQVTSENPRRALGISPF